MSLIGRCDNPMCLCDPCECEDCRCTTDRLGPLEQRVMSVVWASPAEVTVRHVADQLPGYAYTTVATVLGRLSHKGLLRRRTDGRLARYAATRTSGRHAGLLMAEVLRSSDDPEPALAALVAALQPSETATLRRALGVDTPNALETRDRSDGSIPNFRRSRRASLRT